MKKHLLTIVAAALITTAFLTFQKPSAAEPLSFQTYEYATIRWGGRENTHLVRPNGQVEMLGPLLLQAKRPDRVDERSFLMNIALNAVAKEGFDLVTMTPDEFVVRRSVVR